MSTRFSKAYFECLQRGAFPGQVDPWAEGIHYFHQIHGGMIGYLQEKLQGPLEKLGYIAGRETSLTIAERRTLPDIYVEVQPDTPPPLPSKWDYSAQATGIQAKPDFQLTLEESPQDAIYIEAMETGDLVTIIEVVSPGNKIDPDDLQKYRQRREKMLQCQVNINVR